MTAGFLAVLMLVSSTGFSMDMHYCQDVLKSVRLVGEAPVCHQLKAEKEQPACHKQQEIQATSCHDPVDAELAGKNCENDCCSHKVVHAQFDADYLQSSFEFTAPGHAVTAALLYACVQLLPAASEDAEIPYLQYKPPQSSRDITVLYGVFRN